MTEVSLWVWYALDAKRLDVTTETEVSYWLRVVSIATMEAIGVTVAFSWAGTFAFAEKTFCSRRSSIMLKRMLLGFYFATDGLDILVALKVAIFRDSKLVHWINVWNDLILQGLVDKVDILLSQFSHILADKAFDGVLLDQRLARFGIHEGGTQNAE